jgi:hypothetical protein
VDPAGNTISVTSWTTDGKPAEVQRSTTVNGTTTTESYLFTYISSGGNAGLLQNETLRRQVNGGSWTTVRQAVYTYYNGTESYGNLGDLKLAQVEDASGNVLDTKYYRYYTSGQANGYTHGLRYLLNADAYARAAAALGDPTTATDSQLAPYADLYLEYDSFQRVTKETVRGQGGSSTSGLGTFTFSVSVRPTAFLTGVV